MLYDLDLLGIQDQIAILGNGARAIIKARDLKKKQIAAKTQLSVNTINNFIQGKNINLGSLLKIAWVMGMNLPDFIVEAENIVKPFPESPLDPNVEEKSEPAVDTTAVQEELETSGIGANQLAFRMGVEKDRVETLVFKKGL